MNEYKDLVSVIIPIYNGEKYIEKCVDSLLVQTYKNIEILLVNDGSKDSSGSICDELLKKDNRVKVIHKINGGVSSARNLGIDNCKGKYITFIDVDDTVSHKYVEYLYKLMIENNSDVSLTRYPLKFNDNTLIKNESLSEDKVEIFNGFDAAKEMLLYKIVISSWNKMFSKELLKNNDIKFNEMLSFGEGFEFVINCFLHAKKVAIGNVKIYHYRVDNENSVMTKFSRKLVTGSIDSQKSILNMINCLDVHSKIKKNLIKCWNYSNWHTNCDCLNTILGCNVKKDNMDLYSFTNKNCKKYALSSLKCAIPLKDKIKAVSYWISPSCTGKVINKFRIRKYTKEC